VGLFSYSDQEMANQAVAAAQAALEEDRLVFAYALRGSPSNMKHDSGTLVTLAVDGILRLGWELFSVTPYINTIAINNEEYFLVFKRPAGPG
jgi:hypothetical protein